MPLFHDFRSRLRSGETLIGTLVTLSAVEVAEILADAGYDWLFIDSEHAPFDAVHTRLILQAVDHRCPCLVRIPGHEDFLIKKALDTGAAGLIVPQVNTSGQAERIVRSCKYPMQGSRGVGLARAQRYGYGFEEYVEQANDAVSVILQAEHIQAVENIEDIIAVPGVDAILIGPYDLSASIGKTGQVDHPEVIAAIEHVTAACKEAGVSLGIFGADEAAVRPYMDEGYNLIAVGVDAIFLGSAARETLGKLRSSENT